MNLLLIDSRVKDINTIINSITINTRYIIIDYYNDDLQYIKNNITHILTDIANTGNQYFDRIGIFRQNYNLDYYRFTEKFNSSTLKNVGSVDVELDTWNEFIDLLYYCQILCPIEINIDIFNCNISSNDNWLYVINKIKDKMYNYFVMYPNINVSLNKTGNTAMMGDWILEYGNVNLVGLYFTEQIYSYKYVLDVSNISNVSNVVNVSNVPNIVNSNLVILTPTKNKTNMIECTYQ